MYSIFNCSSAAATSVSFARANSFGNRSSASPAPLIALTSSRVVSGFCAANNSASMTCARFMKKNVNQESRKEGEEQIFGGGLRVLPFSYFPAFLIHRNRTLHRLRNPIRLRIALLHLAAFAE